jgi:sugar lactone lactonase YvrE
MPILRQLPSRLARAALAVAALAALAAPAPAAAQAPLLEREASFGSELGPAGRFHTPAGVATDSAGRVYVADSGTGRVEVYDRAADGNAFVRTIGEDVLRCPVGIAIDNRNRIYVADGCREVVVMFDSLQDAATVRREFGTPGTARGQLGSPRFVDADHAARIYVAERANVRVQSWRPSGSRQVPITAFGVGDPERFDQPEGIARDGSGRIFVSDDSASDGEVRAFDSRGLLLGAIAGPSLVSGPRGIELDPVERLLVADSGNGRLLVLAPFSAGSGPLGASEPGVLVSPADAAMAPGALVYVSDAGTGRVVRLRYDDADRDGALDARDVCPGLADPSQVDTDRDGRGDACDEDDDGDTVADADDRCPRTLRGLDANRDGCGDPRSRISSPSGSRRAFARATAPRRVSGSASGDELGVERVEVALAIVRGSTCRWFDGTAFGAPASCDAPAWRPATLAGTRWAARIRATQRGTYRLMSRAVQNGGVAESRFNRSNLRVFRVR